MPRFAFFRQLGLPGHLNVVRASLGAMTGILLTAWISHQWLGDNHGLPTLVGPMGASAVLLFAVPASPLAQPWSIIGGNVLSTLVGVACAAYLPGGLFAGAAAVALAIVTMRMCRCLHPPGGAMALTTALGGPAIAKAGFAFAFFPVGLNAVLLLLVGILFNNATRHRYPHRAAPAQPNAHGTRDPLPQDRVGFTTADIDAVLARYDELLDVSRDDLDTLFRQVEARAHRRLHRALSCADIMSRDVIVAHPDEGVGQARDRLLGRNLSAMPVVDGKGHPVGIVGHAQLLAGNGRLVQDVLDPAPYRAAPDLPIDELLPALSTGLHHDALIVDPDGKLAGMITQTDLLAALWRSHVAEQVASAGPQQSTPV
ncbi:HPP family protein [Caenibius sp. WL]|uniref:HPP family protein n=1 Tax=Caenibius sp. WL TaxID=2872646 RepID=UPI001C997529|nr:HPP family protein [Caenibius sp. WL]QZP09227.1 HPP family protein [Caenibius sp. WL]